MRNKNQKRNNWFDDYITYKLVTEKKTVKEPNRSASQNFDAFRFVRNALIAVTIFETIGALIKIFY